jgi:hypothetical protein
MTEQTTAQQTMRTGQRPTLHPMRRNMISRLPLVAVAALLASCGHAAAAPATPVAAAAPAAPSAAAAANLAPGPFTAKVTTCGRLSAAQQDRFGSTIGVASTGVVVTFTDVSHSVTGIPQATVEFMDGSTVDGQNYSPPEVAPISPGQTEQVAAAMGPSIGAGRPGDTCRIVSYAVRSVAGQMVGIYAP